MPRQKPHQVRFDSTLGKFILDRLSEAPSIVGVARLAKVNVRTVYWWCYASGNERAALEAGKLKRKPKFYLRWPQEDPDAWTWFHEGVKITQRMVALTAHAENLQAATYGDERVIRDPRTNRTLFKLDYKAIRAMNAEANPFDPAIMKEAENFYDDFPYLHDAEGNRIPEVERTPQAAALKIHSLRAILPDVYDLADKKEVKTDSTQRVFVVGDAAPPPQSSELRRSLEEKLRELRERGPANPRPLDANGRPLPVFAPVGASDPPEKITGAPAELPPPTLAEHPRAYHAPKPPAPKPADYRRPTDSPDRPADHSGVGRGVPHSGGVRVA